MAWLHAHEIASREMMWTRLWTLSGGTGACFFFSKAHRHINGVATNAETFGHMAPLGEAGFLIINI